MNVVDWKLRARVFLQRLWQPTFACMACMTAPTFANLVSAAHWRIALQTGIGTGILALLITLTPAGRLFRDRYWNAAMMGALTAIADAWSHPGRFNVAYGEALLTGLVSGVLVLAGSFVLEDGARRVRQLLWRMRGTGMPR